MSNKRPTVTLDEPTQARIAWPRLHNGESGLPFETLETTDFLATSFGGEPGRFEGRDLLTLEGSEDGAKWSPLSDNEDLVISSNEGRLRYIKAPFPKFIRPTVSPNGVGASLSVEMTARWPASANHDLSQLRRSAQ